MDLTISTEKREWVVYGFGERASDKDYAGTAFRLSGKLWTYLKKHGIKNKGKNIWSYHAGDRVFAGVELEEGEPRPEGLEQNHLCLEKYACYKLNGPYSQIAPTGRRIAAALQEKGLKMTFPHIEIYGHWTADEAMLETELYYCLE